MWRRYFSSVTPSGKKGTTPGSRTPAIPSALGRAQTNPHPLGDRRLNKILLASCSSRNSRARGTRRQNSSSRRAKPYDAHPAITRPSSFLLPKSVQTPKTRPYNVRPSQRGGIFANTAYGTNALPTTRRLCPNYPTSKSKIPRRAPGPANARPKIADGRGVFLRTEWKVATGTQWGPTASGFTKALKLFAKTLKKK